jgi:tryptophan 6-halogenase
LDEKDFIRHCGATFKAAVKFIDWDRAPDGTAGSYYHPFSFPPYLNGYAPAYHVNTRLFAGYLGEYCKTVGVTPVLDVVVDAERDKQGHVSSLTLERSGDHPVEFVIDCSGFRSLILQQALEEPFVSSQESLPYDRAIPMPVDHVDPDGPLPPFATSTGLSAGWSWNVQLWSRRGTGYVYSSAHTSDDEAMAA